MKGKERYEQILDCTLELAGEKPLAAIRTAEIARRANISEGALFKYFKSKEEIFDGIIQRYLNTNHPLVNPESITSESDFKEYINTYLKSMIVANPQRKSYLRLLLQISMDQHSAAFQKYEKIKNGFHSILNNRIEYGKIHWGYDKKIKSLIHVRLFHSSILMLVIGQEVFCFNKFDKLDLDEVIKIAIENFFILLQKG